MVKKDIIPNDWSEKDKEKIKKRINQYRYKKGKLIILVVDEKQPIKGKKREKEILSISVIFVKDPEIVNQDYHIISTMKVEKDDD